MSLASWGTSCSDLIELKFDAMVNTNRPDIFHRMHHLCLSRSNLARMIVHIYQNRHETNNFEWLFQLISLLCLKTSLLKFPSKTNKNHNDLPTPSGLFCPPPPEPYISSIPSSFCYLTAGILFLIWLIRFRLYNFV
jgi:hypothetical protein